MSEDVILIKRDHTGKEVWRYSGRQLRVAKDGMLVEARFNRSDLPFHGMIFKQNDRFVELYLVDQWFNIYEIHDRDDDAIKGWYCNVTRPPLIQPGQIAYDDLALDLLVYPDGRQLVLDENEFEELALSLEDHENARSALERLKELFKNPAQFRFEKLLERD
jgi:predicted RNA-binding protein associated with RNAse of E/G family